MGVELGWQGTCRVTKTAHGTAVKTASPRAWSWAALMHRAFGIDVLACAQCGGRLRLIATLHDPAVIRKILAYLALAHSGQSPGPAPPESGAAALIGSAPRRGGPIVPVPRGGSRVDSARSAGRLTAVVCLA
jgi:hypothetical protein